MSASNSWDAYSQHSGLPTPLESYSHAFNPDMRGLTAGSAASGMSSLAGESMLGYSKHGELTAGGLNLTSPYSAYGQSFSGVPDLGFASSSLRSGSSAHSPGAAADNLPASSPHGQYSSTPTSENQSSSPSFPNSTSLYTPSTIANSISSNPYAQAFGGSSSSTDPTARGPFSPFAQAYGYPMYGYNQMGGFPPGSTLEGVNRYMGGISSSPLMQPSAMGLYSNSQAGQMPFPYHPSMGWGTHLPGFQLKESADLMSQDELERYRYRQLSNPYFPGLASAGPAGRSFPPHALQSGMMRAAPFLDDRSHSPVPKKPKKATEEAERAPTPAPRDPATFHSHRGIYLFTSNADASSPHYLGDRYVLLEKDLCEKMSRVSLPGKIQYVYNPLEYAFESHLKFVRRFCTGEKYILFVGMNPGPFGMSQNGVPFGECAIVKEWLQIDGEVLKPVLEHPKRRVVGLECSRSEVTGGRFWQLFRTLCHTPEHFFRTSYVHNLCPFAFLTDSGKNVTPPQLTSSVLDQINALCNVTLVEVVRLLKSKYVICIGKYALAQAQKALSADEFSGITLECLMHPSPINPAANKGWADIAIKQLTEIGVIDIIRYGRVPYQPPSQPPSLSHPPHSSSSSSSSSTSQHSHHSHSYQNKQSPGHYGFQSPPGQPYQHLSQNSNNHQSPVHTAPPNQSPAHSSSRNQSSPAHASAHNPPSPGHLSCSHSPAQQQSQPAQSPAQTTTGPSQQGDPPLDCQYTTSNDAWSSDKTTPKDTTILETSAACDDKTFSQINSNGIPAFSSNPMGHGHENGMHSSKSESGSQSSDTSEDCSPSGAYSSGNPHSNTTEAQFAAHMTLPNPHMPNSSSQMNATGHSSHLSVGSSLSHLRSGLPGSSSPGPPQGRLPDHHGGLTGPQITSPHMDMASSHMAAAHMGAHLQMGMGAHGSSSSQMNPYSHMEMGQMGGYGPSMSLNSYAGAHNMRAHADMVGYSHHMALQNPSMGLTMPGIHGGRHMGSQLGMFSPHLGSMMSGSEHHPGMNSMYDSSQVGKELLYGSHYLDKPPECN